MKYKLLLIDDEPCILDTLAELLEEDDIIVTKASNGMEGLELLKNHKFDIVVSDINMPFISGPTMFSLARAQGIFVPHVFFSAQSNPKIIQGLLAEGATAVVPKPYFEKLSAEINSILNKRELLDFVTTDMIHATREHSLQEHAPV